MEDMLTLEDIDKAVEEASKPGTVMVPYFIETKEEADRMNELDMSGHKWSVGDPYYIMTNNGLEGKS